MANPGALAIVSPALLVVVVGLWLATRLVGRTAPATRPAVVAASHREVLQRYRSPAASTATAPARLVSVPAGDAGANRVIPSPMPDEGFEADRREVA
ncbi:MAG: hypothetical protein U0Q07_10585 [Acidimicrobiales bacterium]